MAEKQVIDVFRPWSPVDEMAGEDLAKRRLPGPILHVPSVPEANFDLTENQTLPYDVLETKHSIDLTGFHASVTRHGNIYRSYVLMRGLSAMPWVASARGKRVSIPSPAMAAAQRVAEEVLVTCRQPALLALTQEAGPANYADPERPEISFGRRHCSRVRYLGKQTAHLGRSAGFLDDA